MRLGVHCSVRGGMLTALEEARRLGCQTLQIFTHAPRQWRHPLIADPDAEVFRARRKAYGLYPLVVHTPYLPNLCTSHARLYARSLKALKDDLAASEKLGADFLVIHPGAFSDGETPEQGMKRLSEGFNEALSESRSTTRVLLENMAGGGRRLGSTWEELERMIDRIRFPERVGVCFDTAHVWGAGHPFSNPEEVHQTLQEFDRRIGLNRLHVIHANDSKALPGSHRDLHEHIGKGHLGEKVFAALFKEKRLKDCAVILETPKDTSTADQRNLAILRRLM